VADLPSIVLSALGIAMDGSAKVTNLNTSPNIAAKLNGKEFSPRDVMNKLGMEVPATTDSSVLTSAAASLGLNISETALSVNDLKARLDETNLTGKASIKNFAAPNIGFDLNVDKLDADRYMPPEGQSSAPAEGQGEPGATGQDDSLKKMVVNGKARVGEFKLMNLTITDIAMTITGKNGRFALDPMTAKLYNGQFKGALAAGLGETLDRPAAKIGLSGMSIGDFLQDYTGGLGWIGGTTSLNLDVKSQGGVDPVKTLSGAGDAEIKHGVIRGFTLIPGSVSQLAKGGSTGYSSGNSTQFDKLGAAFDIQNGQLDFKNLFMVTAASKLEAPGAKLDLVGGSADIPLNMLSDQIGGMVGLPGGINELPLKLSGPWDSLKLGLDEKAFKDLLAKGVKGEAESKLKEAVGGSIPGLGGGGSSAPAEDPGKAIKEGIGGFFGGKKKK
jgi:AsmA protein